MTTPSTVLAAARAAADAEEDRLVEAMADENPVQCYVVGSVSSAALTFTGRIEGQTRTGIPYAPPYFPNAGDVCWLRGPSGAKVATDRVNGGVGEHQIDATLTRILYDLIVNRNMQVDGFLHVIGQLYTDDNLTALRLIVQLGAEIGGALNCGPLGVKGTATVVGNVNSAGAVLGANGLLTGGPANVGALGAGTGTFAGNVNCPNVVTGSIVGNGNDTFVNQIATGATYSPAYLPPASRADLKTNPRPVADYLGMSASELLDRLGADVQAFEYDPEAAPKLADGVTRVGFMVDTLEEAAPHLVVRPPEVTESEPRPADEDYVGPQTADEAWRAVQPEWQVAETYNLVTLVNLALAAHAERSQELAAITARLDAGGL